VLPRLARRVRLRDLPTCCPAAGRPPAKRCCREGQPGARHQRARPGRCRLSRTQDRCPRRPSPGGGTGGRTPAQRFSTCLSGWDHVFHSSGNASAAGSTTPRLNDRPVSDSCGVRRPPDLLIQGKVAVGHPLRGETLACCGPGGFTHRGPTRALLQGCRQARGKAGSSAGERKPVFPSSIISGMPPTRVDSTGNPVAMASITDRGCPSLLDERAKRSRPLSKPATSVRWPRK